MAGSIVDPYGRPVRSSPGAYQFFEGSYERGQRERAWGYYNGAADWDKLLDIGEWLQLLSASRFLFANVPIVRGILMEQARFSFPLAAHYAGKDKEFGKEAEQWLYAWKQNNNVRGWPYNAHVTARIRMLARKVDGDVCTAFVKRDGQFPKIQIIRAHRIGDPGPKWQDGNGVLKAGPYKGFRVRNGVVTDEYRQAVAYCVPGEKPEETQFLPADSAFLTYNPEYSDQDRGVPEVIAAIRSYADLKRLRDYEMRAQQICASLTVIEKNATGTADAASDAVNNTASPGQSTAGTASGLNVEVFGAGLVRYIKAGDGSGLEAFRGDRPSSDARAWEDKIVTAAIYSTGWDPNFALAIKEPGGAWARTILQKINAGINENVCIEARDQAREDYWALSWAVKEKVIRPPSDGDIHSWNYEREALPITSDSGNDLAAIREGYKLGTTSLRSVASAQNQWWVELREQREIEARDLFVRARNLMTEFADLKLTFQECLQILEQRTPNANTPAQAAAADAGQEDPQNPTKETK